MRTADYDFLIPEDLIAQNPSPQRDDSRLMVLDRATRKLAHHSFHDFVSFLSPGDLLVLNDSKVFPARLRAINPATSGRFEILLLQELRGRWWWSMMKPGKRAKQGTRLRLITPDGSFYGPAIMVRDVNPAGHRLLEFEGNPDIYALALKHGELPLPPYITRPPGPSSPEDLERYQTIYARETGSVAAPTAGLHFTPDIMRQLSEKNVDVAFVTLHVGLGTFSPVKSELLEDHLMHTEQFSIPAATLEKIARTKKRGNRVVAVGTTSVRVLETVFQSEPAPVEISGATNIFIHPPHKFRVVDALLTNFHLPRSTLLMLVSAFASPGSLDGREFILGAYQQAVANRYRFFSYGDAMLIH